jgi:hypothetical protein
MRIPKYTGAKWKPGQDDARKAAAAEVRAGHATAQNVPQLRAIVSALAKALGVVTPE